MSLISTITLREVARPDSTPYDRPGNPRTWKEKHDEAPRPATDHCSVGRPAASGAEHDTAADRKVKNYLPHMTRPDVESLLTRSDMVIIPVASLEQHGTHLPIGTDYLNGVERAKLVAQRIDVLVAPILLPGQSPYHM